MVVVAGECLTHAVEGALQLGLRRQPPTRKKIRNAKNTEPQHTIRRKWIVLSCHPEGLELAAAVIVHTTHNTHPPEGTEPRWIGGGEAFVAAFWLMEAP